MGPVQPPHVKKRKGRLSQYAHDRLQMLQNKFDKLKQKGVFARPEDVGINTVLWHQGRHWYLISYEDARVCDCPRGVDVSYSW